MLKTLQLPSLYKAMAYYAYTYLVLPANLKQTKDEIRLDKRDPGKVAQVLLVGTASQNSDFSRSSHQSYMQRCYG